MNIISNRKYVGLKHRVLIFTGIATLRLCKHPIVLFESYSLMIFSTTTPFSPLNRTK